MWKRILLVCRSTLVILIAVSILACAEEAGIGISVSTLEQELGGGQGIEFENAPLDDGRARKVGNSPDGFATLELIGPEDNLSRVSLVLNFDPSAPSRIARYPILLISAILPDWEDGAKFYRDSRRSLEMMGPDANDSFSIQRSGMRISLTAVPRQPIVILNFYSADVQLAEILPTTPPTPAVTEIWDPSKWKTGEWEEKKVLGRSNVLWVGAIGNGGLHPGTYEYRDINGGRVARGDGCHLMINRGDPSQKRIQAKDGQPFSYQLRPNHQYVSFGGFKGSTCDGQLYRMGD